jgi:hypothetical protein
MVVNSALNEEGHKVVCTSSGPIGQIRGKISLHYGTGLGHCLYSADCTASFAPGSIFSSLVFALG